jgi:hypothetical protein
VCAFVKLPANAVRPRQRAQGLLAAGSSSGRHPGVWLLLLQRPHKKHVAAAAAAAARR